MDSNVLNGPLDVNSSEVQSQIPEVQSLYFNILDLSSEVQSQIPEVQSLYFNIEKHFCYISQNFWFKWTSGY